ncbi:GreA/GreB family elongation factor [Myxococcota bacterium]|jgi:transcription elongation factor GreB|nr:GreA/GreB family elongation factor [Myxococcota bacterium]
MANYVTPRGYRKIVVEFDQLLKVERPKITAEVAYAASLGDRSENAEYIYGKKRLREIDRRLGVLKGRLDGIEVIDPATLTGAVVRFGATVTVEDEDGLEQTLAIVGEDESDPKLGRISYKSPIGRALIGKAEGDEVTVTTPKGPRGLTILAVRWLPTPDDPVPG